MLMTLEISQMKATIWCNGAEVMIRDTYVKTNIGSIRICLRDGLRNPQRITTIYMVFANVQTYVYDLPTPALTLHF